MSQAQGMGPFSGQTFRPQQGQETEEDGAVRKITVVAALLTTAIAVLVFG